MLKDIRVLIVEDDPYARDLMSMLLTRDWRTHVINEMGFDAESRLKTLFSQPTSRVDVIVLDIEAPADPRWPARIAEMVLAHPKPPLILYTCTNPVSSVLEHLPHERFGGIILKGELLYSLATAVSLVFTGNFVVTPGTHQYAATLAGSKHVMVIDGRTPVANFTPRERDLVRLGILFNLAQRDISDELVLSSDFIAEVMGQVYDKLGLHELLSGENPLETYFTDETVLARCRSVMQRMPADTSRGVRKAPWMSTIAFHLLTAPDIEEG